MDELCACLRLLLYCMSTQWRVLAAATVKAPALLSGYLSWLNSTDTESRLKSTMVATVDQSTIGKAVPPVLLAPFLTGAYADTLTFSSVSRCLI